MIILEILVLLLAAYAVLRIVVSIVVKRGKRGDWDKW